MLNKLPWKVASEKKNRLFLHRSQTVTEVNALNHCEMHLVVRMKSS